MNNQKCHNLNGTTVTPINKGREVATQVPFLGEEQWRARRRRARVLGFVLAGLVILFFIVTIVKLGGNVANRPF
ncbi:MAG: hypothetical protein V6Z81_06250 [Parvularculales bacterium]